MHTCFFQFHVSKLKPPNFFSMPISKQEHEDLNLKATELRLGLPGSESPERSTNAVKNLVSRAKRGYSDTINIGSSTWGLSDNGGCEVGFVKNGGFLSENKNSDYVKGDVASSLCSPKHVLHDNHSLHSLSGSKVQVVGWPPIRSFRKNSMAAKNTKNEDNPNATIGSCVYVKVSMDGAPYLRKVDLKIYSSYLDLSLALEKMFGSFTLGQYGTHGLPRQEGSSESPLMDLLNGSEYVLTYEDKDGDLMLVGGDLMLVGDVPWGMFTGSCKRMRVMKSSDAIGLAPRVIEECKSHN